MIEGDIEQAKMKSDLIDISDLPKFIEDVKNGNLVFYKDENNIHYPNFASDAIAENYRGEEGKKYFNKAKKLNAKETQELLKRMQTEKDYRYQYFG